MAALKSTLLTNRDAVPALRTDAFISGGVMKQSYGFVFTGASDAAGTTYRLCSVPSDTRLNSLEYAKDTLGSGCFLDVAVWYPTAIPVGGGSFLSSQLGGVCISSSNFLTNIADAAQNTWSTLTSLANTRQEANFQEMPLWQMLGMVSDPEISLDIGFSVRLAVASAGYVGMKATYVDSI